MSAKTQVNEKAKIDKIEAEEDDDKEYICQTCGKPYKRRKSNFTPSASPLYVGCGGYLNTCRSCIDKLFVQFTEFYSGSEEKAIERICQIFDLYFNESALSASVKISADRSRIGTYISKINLKPHTGKTYSDTIIESLSTKIETVEDIKDIKNPKLTQKSVRFWGTGFTEEDYIFLNDKYDEWISRHECKTKAQESIFQKICMLELQIMRASQKGDKLEGLISAYNQLLGSGNLKPVQNTDNTLADQNTFGMLIQKWENEKPIPEPDPEWQDVDGIIKYISIWFLGHLCKMVGIKNSYSKMYEEEIEKYRVEKPEYIEDEELNLDEVFGGAEHAESK